MIRAGRATCTRRSRRLATRTAPSGFDYNNFASIRFSSELNNGELNLRRRVLMRPGCYEASFLVGGRYLQIGEEFGYLTQSSTPDRESRRTR